MRIFLNEKGNLKKINDPRDQENGLEKITNALISSLTKK